MTPLINTRLEDRQLEEVRRNHHEAIRELQKLPIAVATVIPGVKLLDGVTVPVAHGLGRRPVFIRESIPRPLNSDSPIVATGRIVEDRSGGFDAKQVVAIKATGWGADIVVDLLVF